jgi:hypothetical protein
MPDVLPANLDSLRRIVAERQAYRLHWPASKRRPKVTRTLVDGLTANAVVTVYDALLDDANKARMRRLIETGPDMLVKVAEIAWRRD